LTALILGRHPRGWQAPHRTRLILIVALAPLIEQPLELHALARLPQD